MQSTKAAGTMRAMAPFRARRELGSRVDTRASYIRPNRLGIAGYHAAMRLESWVAVLLGISPVVACGTASPPTPSSATQTSTSTASTTGTDDTGDTTSTTTLGSTGDEGTTSTDAQTSSSGTSSGTTSSSSSSEATGTSTGEEGNEACASGCAVEFACGSEWTSEEECVSWCEANLEKAYAFSIFCRAAWEGVSACVGTLSCEEFMVWENPVRFPYPCSDADTVLSIECKGQ